MGGVRAQFSTAVNIQMSLYAIPFFRTFEEAMGHPAGYRGQGYLFVATNTLHLDYLNTNYARQVALGLKTVRLVSQQEISSMVPQLRCDDVVGGSFCSTDGFVDPYSVMNGFTLRALDQGAQIRREAVVGAIEVDGQGVTAVKTTQGTIATRTVVNAAGAWAAEVAKMAALDLPVEPLLRIVVPTEPV